MQPLVRLIKLLQNAKLQRITAYTHTHTHMHAYTHTHTHTHMHTHTHVHTHMHTHTTHTSSSAPGEEGVPYPDELVHTPGDYQGARGTEVHCAHSFGDLEHLVVIRDPAFGWNCCPQSGPSPVASGGQEIWRSAPRWRGFRREG